MRYQDLYYIVKLEFSTVCYYREGQEEITSIDLWLNKLFNEKLKDYKAYKKVLKKVIKVSQMAPIYYDRNLLLWQMKAIDKTRFYINYYQIKDIKYHNFYVQIIFKDERVLYIKKSRQSVYRDLNKIKKVINYLEINNIE